MAWERRRNRLYYFRCFRGHNGRVRKQYIGTGREAEDIARRDAARRAERADRRREELELRQQFVTASSMLTALGGECDDLVVAALADAGIYQHHRGVWRRYGGKSKKV